MNKQPKDKKSFYRTHPYHAPERLREDFVFWVMENAREGTGFDIKEFSMGYAADVPSGAIERIAGNLSRQDALLHMDRLEQAAAAKYSKVDDGDEFNFGKLGIEYSKAEHYKPHYQSAVSAMNHDQFRQNRKQPPKLGM